MQKLIVGNFYKSNPESNSMYLWYCSPIGKMQLVCSTRVRGTYAGTSFYSPAVLKSNLGITEFSSIPEDEYKQGYLIYHSMNYYSLCPVLYDWKQVAKSGKSRIVKQEDSIAEAVASLFSKGAKQVDVHNMATFIKRANSEGFSLYMYYGKYDLKLGNEFWY